MITKFDRVCATASGEVGAIFISFRNGEKFNMGEREILESLAETFADCRTQLPPSFREEFYIQMDELERARAAVQAVKLLRGLPFETRKCLFPVLENIEPFPELQVTAI